MSYPADNTNTEYATLRKALVDLLEQTPDLPDGMQPQSAMAAYKALAFAPDYGHEGAQLP